MFSESISKPQIVVPDCWPVTEERINAVLDASKGWRRSVIGRSAAGRNIHGVSRDVEGAAFRFGVIGGTHGHEPGGVAAACNLIRAAETGRDLLGREWDPILRRVAFSIIPLLNPDARLRCWDSLVGMSIRDVHLNSASLDRNGRQMEGGDRVPTGLEVAHLGGRYNDDGVDIWSATDGTLDGTQSVEVQAAARFFASEQIDLVIDFHAHGFYPLFYTPIAGVRDDAKRLSHQIAEEVRARGSGEYEWHEPEGVARSQDDFEAEVPPGLLYHNVTGAVPFLIEGPQGTVDSEEGTYGGRTRLLRSPAFGHEKIVAVYLFAVQEISRLYAGRT